MPHDRELGRALKAFNDGGGLAAEAVRGPKGSAVGENRMGKTIGAVMAGTVFWGVLCNGGNYDLAEAFPDIITMDEPIKAAPMLLGRGFYSAVLSVAAGFTVAAIQSSPDATAG